MIFVIWLTILSKSPKENGSRLAAEKSIKNLVVDRIHKVPHCHHQTRKLIMIHSKHYFTPTTAQIPFFKVYKLFFIAD